jgi:hypothetical protein
MNPTPEITAEPLVDAQTAAAHLNLPRYYLTHQAKRQALKVPHYRIGRLLRFRISELDAWLLATATVGGRPMTDEPVDPED